jgi:trimeric autotransporter adhesin
MATYVNDLRLTELATGEGSGTWGTTTNTSLELIGEALGYATQQAFGSDADATTTVADGASDPARAMYYKITSAASLTATRTLTIAPNTISRVMFIENATSGSQSIAISQGSGASVTILTGKTAVVYLDGAGATAAVVDAMAGVDPGVTDTLTEVLVAGNTSGGTNIELSTTDKVQFRDAAIYLNSSVDGQLDIVADTEIQIAATTVDLNGDLDVSGTTLVTGVLTTTAATVFNGGFASNADSTLGTDKKVQFRDSAIYINSSVDGQLDIVADTEIQIAATTVDLNGNLDVSGTALVTGVLTTTAATVFNGGFASNADSTLGTDKKVQFRDSAIYINSSVDGQLDIVADTEIQIAATTIDIDGAINASGEIIAASLDISGNVDVDGTIETDALTINSIGGLGNVANDLAIYSTEAGHNGLRFHVDGILPTDNAGAIIDADADLGIETYRFKDLFLSGIASAGGIITPTAGTSNFVAGVNAGNSIASGGNYNVVVGDEAGTALTTGDGNVAVGFNALAQEDEHGLNVAIGNGALYAQNAGVNAYNTAVGYSAGFAVTTGTFNTLIGGLAGDGATTASYSTALGYGSLGGTMTGEANVALGVNTLLVATSAHSNTAVGTSAMSGTTTGTNNVAVGRDALDANTTASNNTAVGYASLGSNTEGDSNVAVGFEAGFSNTVGTWITALGYKSLYSATAGPNIGLGYEAAYNITTGSNNVALGPYRALYNNTTGNSNVAIGRDALNANINASNNTAVGYQVGYSANSGSGVTAFGYQAMYSNTTGDATAMGYKALFENITGTQNTAHGYEALRDNTTGGYNTAVGAFTLQIATTGSYNTAVGRAALDVLTEGIQNSAFGAGALGGVTTGNNNVGLGVGAGGGITTGGSNIAIGISTLASNTTGGQNIAIGQDNLFYNTADYNTAVGHNAMVANTSGTQNVAVGAFALDVNNTASNNTAVGYASLSANTTASNNTAVGYNALTANSTGADNVAVGSSALGGSLNDGNTAVGHAAGAGITTGQYNTAIGLVSAASLVFTGSFNSSIGYNANPSAAGSSGQFTLGDANISDLRCNDTSISALSDSRDKTDVINSPYGLDFINTVRPVQFKWETRDGNAKDGSTRIGFLAQELLEATDGNNAVLDLVLDDNPEKLEAKYGNLLPIAIKAIQELSTQLNAALARIETLEG